MAAVNLLCLPV